MVKALILYFLSLKSTHGYEIQKYIQLNQMDDWTKIQSGSIYYALNKLHREGFIDIIREEESGGKIRKVYGITDTGRGALEETLLSEINKPIYAVGSDKFILFNFLGLMDRDKLVVRIEHHIKDLEIQKEHFKGWEKMKASKESLGVTKLSFRLMIDSLSAQIDWHNQLLEELDQCIAQSREVANFIKSTDFAQTNHITDIIDKTQAIDILQIKKAILDNPEEAEAILAKLIKDNK